VVNGDFAVDTQTDLTDPKTDLKAPAEADAEKRREELARLFERGTQGDRSVLPELGAALDANPDFWEQYGDLSLQAEASLGVKLAGTNLLFGESLKRKLQALKAELGAASSAAERLLVEQVTITWQQTHYYNSLMAQTGVANAARLKTLQGLLDAAQRRHLASLKALAAVRKLLRPAVSPLDLLKKEVGERGAGAPGAGRRASTNPAEGVGVVN
jgi:hypothetical protein